MSKRVRRSPTEARALILEAARKVLAEKGPDAAGLKDIAAEAGVSHALVSHYFGTFDGVVEAALEAYVEASRARLLERLPELREGGPASIVDFYFDALSDPSYGRLAAWALLSGRLNAHDFFPRRQQGMRIIADALEANLGTSDGPSPIERDELEALIMLVVTVGLGYSVGRDVLWDSIGKRPTKARDARFRKLLGRMLELYAEDAGVK